MVLLTNHGIGLKNRIGRLVPNVQNTLSLHGVGTMMKLRQTDVEKAATVLNAQHLIIAGTFHQVRIVNHVTKKLVLPGRTDVLPGRTRGTLTTKHGLVSGLLNQTKLPMIL